MENASKALLIAGEILIAILLLGVLVYGYNNLSYFMEDKQTDTQRQQLTAFNKQYESYNRKLLRGVDVISVMNKAISNNTKYEGESYYNIDVTFEMAEACVYYKDSKNGIQKREGVFEVGTIYKMEEFSSKIPAGSEAFTDFKRRVFDCTEIKYNSTSGRVNYMHFKERKLEEEEYYLGF